MYTTQTFHVPRICLLLALLAALAPARSSALDENVHWMLSQAAFRSSLGLNAFLTGILQSEYAPDGSLPLLTTRSFDMPPNKPGSPVVWLSYGSYQEDMQDATYGGYHFRRSCNHFYTITPQRQPGEAPSLTDDTESVFFFKGRLPAPIANSFVWATTPGMLEPSLPFGPGDANIDTWWNARQVQYQALTLPQKIDRDAALALMLYSLGHVLHLNQDLSQPEHVRNDEHRNNRAIEKFGKKRYFQDALLSPTLADQLYPLRPHGWLYWRDAGFTKLRHFWDRGLYFGTASPLDHDANGDSGWQLGLAEFTSGNFLGQDAIYAESFAPGTRDYALHYFPYPSRNTSTTYFQIRKQITSGTVSPMDYPDGSSGNRVYLRKVADGLKGGFRHSVLPYLVTMRLNSPQSLEQSYREGRPRIDDPNVLSDYHSILIPKAIEYSAGILDYFFRGKLEVSAAFWAGQYQLHIVNRSGQALRGGVFTLYQDDGSGNRTSVPLTMSWADSSTLAEGVELDGTFAGSFTDGAKFILVYRGTIGIDGTLEPLDSVDANIAIAAKSFQPTMAQSSYEVASLPRPGFTVLGAPLPVSDVAYDANGVLRRWLRCGVRKRESPDVSCFFSPDWDGITGPVAGSVSEYLDETTINRWDASETSSSNLLSGSGGVWSYGDFWANLHPGMSILNYSLIRQSATAGSTLSYTVTETFDVTWPVPDPLHPGQTIPALVTVTATWTQFWENEISIDDVVADCCGIYAAMPSLTPGGASYYSTKNAAGTTVSGCRLDYAFDFFPAGMGLWYYDDGTEPDEVSICGCILYIPWVPVQRQTVTFDINGQQSSTIVNIPTEPSRYYRLDADCGWNAENITP